MKIEVKITDDDGNVQQYDVSDSPHFNCILNEHYDNRGRLDGGLIIEKGVVRGHIDPKGEEGYPGVVGITDYGYDKEMISPYPMDTQNDVYWCNWYQRGYNQALEDNKDKKYTEEDVIGIVEKSRETGLTAEYLIMTFQSKTEWEVEFVDGKLKLI